MVVGVTVRGAVVVDVCGRVVGGRTVTTDSRLVQAPMMSIHAAMIPNPRRNLVTGAGSRVGPVYSPWR